MDDAGAALCCAHADPDAGADRWRAKTLTERRFLELSWMSAFFLDMLQGLTTLKLFGRSKEQAATIEAISRQYGKTTMEVLATAFQTSLVMEWAATAATALVALEVSYRLMGGALPFAPALAVLLLTPEFFLPLRTLALRYHAGAAGKAALKRIDAILGEGQDDLTQRRREAEKRREGARGEGPGREREAARRKTGNHDSTAVQASKAHFAPRPSPLAPLPLIRFDNVAYSYGNRAALRGCSFTLTPGQRTALVGATGAGKSTIASLLLRFIEPQAGAIYSGDTPLAAIDPDRWRTQVAWVGQHPHLLQGSVLDNLRLARPGATQARSSRPRRLPMPTTLSLHCRMAMQRGSASRACGSAAGSASGWPSRARCSETRRC
ncbi:MAG: ATP-binding cassette domain-containing protein [Anaerolineales bacterium]|nr:ATP-binding cassette domain-containing protein [Anaerolineales bacterium]